jgi:peptidoglycan/xylan/chitin deacetylase (PgdA/CDA1 family)
MALAVAWAVAASLHATGAFAGYAPVKGVGAVPGTATGTGPGTGTGIMGPVPLGLAPRDPGRALRPVRNVATNEPAIAFTFDACATRTQSYGFDRPIYELLKRERIPATLFVSGRWVEGHPDVMAELAQEPLIEFGDHSYEHPHMSRLPAARIEAEIDQTAAALARYGKRAVAFRPPFGEWSSRLIDVVQAKQLPTVTWDIVSGDPSARTTAAGMIKEVVSKARPGSIVVFHINGRGHKTAEALPVIVRELRERGFRFVQVSELIASGAGPPSLVHMELPAAQAPAAPAPPAPPVH